MRKKVLIVLLAMPFMALAQEGASWGNSVRLSYGLMGNTPSTLQDPLEGSGFEDIDAMYGSATVEWSRQINRWLELGLYAGFREGAMLHVTRDFLYIGPSGDTTYTDLEACEKHLTLSYGFTARAHLLPLMGKSNDHWDVYAALHIGGWYCVGNRLEYGLGAGACWYFTRRLGLYAEGLFGQYQAQNFGHLLKGDGKVNIGIVFKY